MGAKSDALQLAALMALFAAGLQYMRSTPGGEDLLQTSRRAMLNFLIPKPTGLSDYVIPNDGNPDQAQPDAVRKAARTVAPGDHAMRCDEEIPAYSSVTSNNVQIFAQGFYKGMEAGEHWWMYRIEFKNVGRQRVQLLARHWVFVDNDGKTVEVKGPGARGRTPKISPGKTFKYESGTPLATSRGSMWGSFQFQVLRLEDGSKPDQPMFFSARVGRLALTEDNSPAKVPCGEEAVEGVVPLTSVWATDQVIVGVTASYLPPEDEKEIFGTEPSANSKDKSYLLDVQVNNGRDETIIIKRVHWTARLVQLTDKDKLKGGAGHTKAKVSHDGVPLGPGRGRRNELPLGPGEATRYEEKMTLRATAALVEGRMEVEIEVGDDEESDEDLYMFREDEVLPESIAPKTAAASAESAKSADKKPRRRTLSLKIARFAVSTDEQTVPDLPPGERF